MSPPHLIDSHAHLDYEELAGNLAGVLGRAEDAGVVGVVAIGTDLASSVRTLELARAHPQLAATAGIHLPKRCVDGRRPRSFSLFVMVRPWCSSFVVSVLRKPVILLVRSCS